MRVYRIKLLVVWCPCFVVAKNTSPRIPTLNPLVSSAARQTRKSALLPVAHPPLHILEAALHKMKDPPAQHATQASSASTSQLSVAVAACKLGLLDDLKAALSNADDTQAILRAQDKDGAWFCYDVEINTINPRTTPNPKRTQAHVLVQHRDLCIYHRIQDARVCTMLLGTVTRMFWQHSSRWAPVPPNKTPTTTPHCTLLPAATSHMLPTIWCVHRVKRA